MSYNHRVYKVAIIFIVLVSLGFAAWRQSTAQVNLRCYQRALLDRNIDCSQCDEIPAGEYSNDITQCEDAKGWVFDVSTCTCVPPSQSCSGWDDGAVERAANSCYSSGGFWNDNYCVCLSNIPGATGTINQDVREISEILFFKTNFDGSVDNVSELVRLAFILFFAVIAVAALFLGIYGMYLYSTAREDEEKVKLAQKVFKNAIMGLAIAVLGIVVVQIVAIFLGVDTQDLFTFTISN